MNAEGVVLRATILIQGDSACVSDWVRSTFPTSSDVGFMAEIEPR